MTSTTQGRRPTGPGEYVYRDEHGERIVLVWETYGPVVTYAAAWIADGERRITTTDNMPGDFIPLTKPVAAPEPDWSQAPEWAMWWAVDASGAALWWETKPYAVGGMWERGQEGLYQEDVTQRPGWQDTLRKRPEVSGE